jgi:hypothetical protein
MADSIIIIADNAGSCEVCKCRTFTYDSARKAYICQYDAGERERKAIYAERKSRRERDKRRYEEDVDEAFGFE